MQKIQIGGIYIEPKTNAIELLDSSKQTSITIPAAELSSVIDFLTFYAETDVAERRRSYRLTVEPNDNLMARIASSSGELVEVDPVDISLGGMLVRIEHPEALSLSLNASYPVRLELDGSKAQLNGKVVRANRDQVAFSFTDCECDGDLVPTVELLRIYSELQRRWLSRRIAH